MRTWQSALVVGLVLIGAYALAARSGADTRNAVASANLTRACVPAIGAVSVTMACTTGTDADSGALALNTVYMMRCDTAAWVRFGAAAVTAVADDWRMGADEVFYISTGGEEAMRHISCLSEASDGDCRLLECK